MSIRRKYPEESKYIVIYHFLMSKENSEKTIVEKTGFGKSYVGNCITRYLDEGINLKPLAQATLGIDNFVMICVEYDNN